MYAVSIMVDGETAWQAGYFPTAADASGWMERNDAQFESLVVDLGKEHRDAAGAPEVDVRIVLVNSIVALERTGWHA